MDEVKLKAAIAFAKANNLKSITVDGITMEILPEQTPSELPSEKDLNLIFNNPDDHPTDEEVLYWATPYYEVLQEQKKRQLETKAEDEDVRNG